MVHEIITQIIHRGIIYVLVSLTWQQKQFSKHYLCNCNGCFCAMGIGPHELSFSRAYFLCNRNCNCFSGFSGRPWRNLPPTWVIHMATRRPAHNTPIHMDLVPFSREPYKKSMWIGVLWAGLRVVMWITHVGGKFRHGLPEKSLIVTRRGNKFAEKWFYVCNASVDHGAGTLSGMFRRSASLAIPHRQSFAAIPSLSLGSLGTRIAASNCHTNRSVKLPRLGSLKTNSLLLTRRSGGRKTGLRFAGSVFLTFRGPLASHDSNPYPNRSRIARYNATKLVLSAPK